MSDTQVDFAAQAANAATPELRWHKRRRQEMLRAHPEIGRLFGPTAATHLLAVGALAAHVAMAIASARLPLVGTVLAAYIVGAWLTGALDSAAHEYGHRLVRGPRWLAWCMVRLSTATNVVFMSAFFDHLHMGHHRSQGSQEKNESGEFVDMEGQVAFDFLRLPATGQPGLWRALQRFAQSQQQIVSSTLVRTAKIVLPIGLLLRSAWRGESPRPFVRDTAVDGVLKLGTYGLLFAVAGWQALVYVWCSDLFLRGALAHPYLAWWVSQHHMARFFSPDKYVPTGSVSGPLYSLLTTHGARHCEHHDFPQVPWHRLAAISKIAPEFYQHVPPERTWSNIVWNYYWRTDLTFAYAHHPLRAEETAERVSDMPAAVQRGFIGPEVRAVAR